jgi:hypothetical protein
MERPIQEAAKKFTLHNQYTYNIKRNTSLRRNGILHSKINKQSSRSKRRRYPWPWQLDMGTSCRTTGHENQNNLWLPPGPRPEQQNCNSLLATRTILLRPRKCKEPQTRIYRGSQRTNHKMERRRKLYHFRTNLNNNAWTSEAAKMIESWGLLNIHTTQHPDLPAVATCNKNRSNVPIGGMWCSPAIEIISAGMTGFRSPDLGKTEHRVSWADFTVDSTCTYSTNRNTTPRSSLRTKIKCKTMESTTKTKHPQPDCMARAKGTSRTI